MGHDISAYQASDKERKNSIAYLRIGAYGSYAIYDALDAREFNGFVSGTGGGRNFTKEQLLKALEYLRQNDSFHQLFIKDCLENLDENEEVYICFY